MPNRVIDVMSHDELMVLIEGMHHPDVLAISCEFCRAAPRELCHSMVGPPVPREGPHLCREIDAVIRATERVLTLWQASLVDTPWPIDERFKP
jgi:hypothetical protein